MNQLLTDEIRRSFQSCFDEDPHLIFSPGRINLIGEHTDYNEGFVFPAAINKGIHLAIGKGTSNSTLISRDMDQHYVFSVQDDLIPVDEGGWINYIIGVVHQMKKAGKFLSEFNIVFGGDIPIGSGLSSSAALENAIGFGLNELFDLGFEKIDLIKMSQKAEHDFVGVRCGIMDQFAGMMGESDKALLLDCKTLEHKLYPMMLEDYALLLCNSNVTHNLAGSEYNVRRAQCEEGISLLQRHYPDIRTLRDVDQSMLDEHTAEFDPVVIRRCQYILDENNRVRAMGDCLEKGDLTGVGDILYAGHEGMRSEYEITCEEIDFMVDFAKSRSEALGARMMGGGFGGCTINLIRRDAAGDFVRELSSSYRSKWDLEMTPINVEISNGAGRISNFL